MCSKNFIPKVSFKLWCLILILQFFYPASVFAKMLTIRLAGNVSTLDWQRAESTLDTFLVSNLMEGLVDYDEQLHIKPALATSWDVSADQKIYTFHLRKDARWSDGKPVTAQDFIDAWSRLLNPVTGSPYQSLLWDIEGAENFSSTTARKRDFSIVGVKAVNETTLVVNLRQPVPFFLQLLAHGATYPMRKDMMDALATQLSKPDSLITNGAYKIGSIESGKQIKLKKNLHYNASSVAVTDVTILLIRDTAEALQGFASHKIDIVGSLNGGDIRAKELQEFVRLAPPYRTGFLSFNVSKYPVNIKSVRQAIAMSLDRKALQEVLGRYTPVTSLWIPRQLFPDGDKVQMPYDPQRAKQLLEEAGLGSAAGIKLELLTYNRDEANSVAEFIKKQISKNLQLEVEVSTYNVSSFLMYLHLQAGALFVRKLGSNYPDPDGFLGIFLSTSGLSDTNWKNPKYDALLKEARSLSPGPLRVAKYLEALDLLLVKDCVIIPLLEDRLLFLVQPRVKNLNLSPLRRFRFKELDLI